MNFDETYINQLIFTLKTCNFYFTYNNNNNNDDNNNNNK